MASLNPSGEGTFRRTDLHSSRFIIKIKALNVSSMLRTFSIAAKLALCVDLLPTGKVGMGRAFRLQNFHRRRRYGSHLDY